MLDSKTKVELTINQDSVRESSHHTVVAVDAADDGAQPLLFVPAAQRAVHTAHEHVHVLNLKHTRTGTSESRPHCPQARPRPQSETHAHRGHQSHVHWI